MKALARKEARPIVAGFFDSLGLGMDLILQLLNVAGSMLNQSIMDWLDTTIGLFNGSHGMFKQVQDWIQEKLTFSVVPKVLETDLSSQLPSALSSRLKLLPLGVPVPDRPELVIQEKEMSVAVQIGDIS